MNHLSTQLQTKLLFVSKDCFPSKNDIKKEHLENYFNYLFLRANELKKK